MVEPRNSVCLSLFLKDASKFLIGWFV
uniref:Uncharacterized protein n=1 Tax=Arundo donax TaxID=35708 RepID=A0A0A8YSC8_ARUDO